MQIALHSKLAGGAIRLQGLTVNCRRVHSMGNEKCENFSIERFSIHWCFGVQRCHHKCYNCCAGKLFGRKSYSVIRYHYIINTSLNDSYIIAAVFTENQ